MYHTIIVVGNLGRDPEMRYTPSGQAVTNFSIASTRRYSDRNGEQREETVWFRISVWGKQAEVCNQYLSRGRQVLIEGRLVPDDNGNPRTFQRQDGTTGASFEINAQMVRFLGSRDDAGNVESGPAAPTGMQTEDDIPF
ncbi:MAG: single-stranded DNA-binding protein [Anaerolineales bacterium]|nr:single-stranded DNA-binding protein [Anaerolineales bacterium]